jgi:serine/threonine-protein kinase
VLGRYVLYGEIARGGMASVHLGRLQGPVGFARTVAIKRLHPHYARDRAVVAMFLEEAKLAARVRHPNVVSVFDIVELDAEIFLVMDYVHGESLARLWDPDQPLEPRLAAAVMTQALLGLHAAHEAKDERGAPLGIVHRDVSPQNILVGEDGAARMVDFGIAKAIARHDGNKTSTGLLKGKLTYMAPERLASHANIDRRADIFSAGVVLWELLTGRRLFEGSDVEVVDQLLHHRPEAPSKHRPGLNEQLDEVCMCALAPEPDARYATARDMAAALARCVPSSGALDVSAWIEARAGRTLRERAAVVAAVERAARDPLAEGTRAHTVPHELAASNPATRSPGQDLEREVAALRRRPLRGPRWLMIVAACAIVFAIVRLTLGSRAREPSIIQVNSPATTAPLPSAPARAVSPPATDAPHDEQRPQALADVPAQTQTAESERKTPRARKPTSRPDESAELPADPPPAAEPRRPARPAKRKVDLGL